MHTNNVDYDLNHPRGNRIGIKALICHHSWFRYQVTAEMLYKETGKQMEVSLATYARQQYEWIRGSRKVLTDFCSQLSPQDFIKETDEIGRGGSVRNLLVHNANTYFGWIAEKVLCTDRYKIEGQRFETIDDIIRLFNNVDEMMETFFLEVLDKKVLKVEFKINDIMQEADAFKLFTHVITHEFHHKGQVLSRCRQLGYVPVDTDVVRF